MNRDEPFTEMYRDELLHRDVRWFQGGLVFKANRLVYHSTLGSRVIKKNQVRYSHPRGSAPDANVSAAHPRKRAGIDKRRKGFASRGLVV